MLPANLAEPERYYEFWRLTLVWGLLAGGVIAGELLAIIVLLALLVRKG